MAILSKKKQQAKHMQQLAVDRHVLSLMHEMLRKYLETTGKFTAEERTIWERDFMVPEMLRHGFEVKPQIYVPVPPKQLIQTPERKLLTEAPKGISVERVVVDTSPLEH